MIKNYNSYIKESVFDNFKIGTIVVGEYGLGEIVKMGRHKNFDDSYDDNVTVRYIDHKYDVFYSRYVQEAERLSRKNRLKLATKKEIEKLEILEKEKELLKIKMREIDPYEEEEW